MNKLLLRIKHWFTGHTWGAGWSVDDQNVICQCGATTPLGPWLTEKYGQGKPIAWLERLLSSRFGYIAMMNHVMDEDLLENNPKKFNRWWRKYQRWSAKRMIQDDDSNT